MKIPILNIFYMLSYSWNLLDESEMVKLSYSDYDSLKQLLSKVLSNGCKYLIKRGIDRSYVLHTEEYTGIKGKLDINESINRSLFSIGKSVCDFDELDYNVIHNQIIKSTIYQLLKDKNLDRATHAELKKTFYNFHKIDVIPLTASSFRKIQVYRNIKHYDLLLRICKLIFDNSTLDEKQGNVVFKDFHRNRRKMEKLFQSFIFNFFKKEQSRFKVRGEKINWAFVSTDNTRYDLVPTMNTDITLENTSKKVIIDTKYYTKTLTTNRFGKEIFYPKDLYQIFSYLLNQEEKTDDPKLKQCIGILLYPKIDTDLNEKFIYKDHTIILKTINLNNEWLKIKHDLLEMIDQL